MNEWHVSKGIWTLIELGGNPLIQIKHDSDLNEYVVLTHPNTGRRLGKQWPEAAKTAEDLSKPTTPVMRGKKGR